LLNIFFCNSRVLNRHIIEAKLEAIDVVNGPVTTRGGDIIFADAEPSEDFKDIKVTFTFGEEDINEEGGEVVSTKTVAKVLQVNDF
jgi:hypothetical protein